MNDPGTQYKRAIQARDLGAQFRGGGEGMHLLHYLKQLGNPSNAAIF